MKTKLCLFMLVIAIVIPACTPGRPEPTATATVTPTVLPTVTPTATPVPNGPCDNPLLPMVTGNHWTYLVTSQSETYQYDLIVGDREDARNITIEVELIDQKHGRDIKERVICLDGAIDNFPLFLMSMLLADYLDGILNTYRESGYYAPSYQELSQNNWVLTWQPKYLLEEVVWIKNPALESSLVLLRNNPIDLSFKTNGIFEPVTVPAGTYSQALILSNDYIIPATVYGSIITSSTLTVRTTLWFVPYVGLIRAQVDSASVFIMAGQESSMQIESVLELTEFKPGK